MERPVAEPTPTQPPRPWRSPRNLADWTIVLILVHIVVVVLNIALTLVNQSQAFSTGPAELTMLLLYGITHFSVVISFLMWIHRASGNLASIGVKNQKSGPVAAVVWWFVPIAWFWMPYSVNFQGH